MENPQNKKTAEHLGIIAVNNGRHAAALMRERDPTGATIVHAVRRSQYVHEKLHSLKRLNDELFNAAEKFREDFERAQLAGNYARLDLFKVRAGQGEMSDNVAAAKNRISKALDALGANSDGPSFAQSCMWNVVGLGMTLDDWTGFVRQGNGRMNTDKASGVFEVSLHRLALHYGLIDPGKLAAMNQDRAYGRGIKDLLEFSRVYSTGLPNDLEKTALAKFLASAQKRFNKFVDISESR